MQYLGWGTTLFLELVNKLICSHGMKADAGASMSGEGGGRVAAKLAVRQGLNKLLAETDGHRHQSISCMSPFI